MLDNYLFSSLPTTVNGNIYNAILVLDKHFNLIAYLYNLASNTWVVGECGFVDEMVKQLFTKNSFYLVSINYKQSKPSFN